MEPGPKLDATVCKAMGKLLTPRPGIHPHNLEPFPVSTDIAACYAHVVPDLRRLGYWVSVHDGDDKHAEPCAYAMCWSPDADNDTAFEVSGKDWPHAICNLRLAVAESEAKHEP